MNNKQEHKRLTRLNQLWVLIILAALTMVMQYALQGALATKADISTFPWWFWVSDYVFWGLRALVDAWCVVFMFTTTPKNKWYAFVLTCFEVGLISLITLTLGPGIRSVGMGKTVADSLSEVMVGSYNAGVLLFWLWNFGIAAYAPMMLASVGFAYRMQPTDNGHSLVDASQLQKYENELRRLEQDAIDAKGGEALALNEAERLRGQLSSAEAIGNEWSEKVSSTLASIAWLAELEPTTQARLLVLASNGNKPTPTYLSQLLHISLPQASKARASADKAIEEILARQASASGKGEASHEQS